MKKKPLTSIVFFCFVAALMLIPFEGALAQDCKDSKGGC
jgi:hypothetical protein